MIRSAQPHPPSAALWRLAGPLLLPAALAFGPDLARARGAAEAVAAGDEHYAASRLDQAVTAYREALVAEPASLAVLCRLARSESELGETQKGDEQRRTWASAVAHARDAVRIAPDSALAHTRLAVALGRQALREGPSTRLALSREIKSEADRAIALDATQDFAWHVLAVWNVKIASLNAFERLAARTILGGVPKGASIGGAEQAFEKAIAIAPTFVNHHLEYGRLLRDEKRFADARRELEKAVALPATSSALDARYQAEARGLLEKLPR